MRTQGEGQSTACQRERPQGNQPRLDLTLQPPELRKSISDVQPISLWHVVMEALANEYIGQWSRSWHGRVPVWVSSPRSSARIASGDALWGPGKTHWSKIRTSMNEKILGGRLPLLRQVRVYPYICLLFLDEVGERECL